MTTQLNNRYQVIQVLGIGGFSETFLAEDTYMPSRRRCVIKQLKPTINDPQTYQKIQRRFEREAETLEYLAEGSDQIPNLYAYFSENGQFYLVQEWIEGQTLTNIVKVKGVLSETIVKEILLSLLSVLDYIHSKGIIHRDIKPDNIILRSSNDKPVLIDFGAVKATIRSVVSPKNLTQSLVVGTPGYMPSEQAVGRPVYATDIYSLGLTAIYLLTGKHPHELQTNPQTGEIIWQDHAPGVSLKLAMVLNRAIKPQAGDRYTTARKMLHALQSATVRRQWLQQRLFPQRTATSHHSPQQTEPPQINASATPTAVTQPIVAQSSANNALSRQNIPATLVYSLQSKRRKLSWFIGSLIVAGLIGAIGFIGITRKPASEIPIATSPSPSPQSPPPTSEEANTPSQPSPPSVAPTPQQSDSQPSPPSVAPTPQQPENEPVTSDTPTVPVASATPEQDNQTPAIAPDNSADTTNRSRVPAFPTGTQRTTVEAALGKPTTDSRGIWRNTRAISYILVPNQIQLGYLFDRDSGVLRQSEVAFAQSVDFKVILATLEKILGGKITEEIKQGLLQVYQRQLDNFRFSVGSLKGQIIRQDCDLIYISVWESDLHDFVNPSDARKC